jgi:hypothetical protein
MELLVAFSTDDGENLFEKHAGAAQFFDVYTFSDGQATFLERRANSSFKGDEKLKHGDPQKAQATLGALEGMHVLVGKTYGPNLPRLLKKLLCVVIRTQKVAHAVEVIKDHMTTVEQEYQKGEAREHLVLT